MADINIRPECRRLIRAAAYELGFFEPEMWLEMYRRLSAVHGTQYVNRAKAMGRPTIEVVQMDGKLPELLALIQGHYGAAAERSLYLEIRLGKRIIRTPRKGQYVEPWEGDDA